MKEDYVIVSFSGGKDSTAMLLHMIEERERVDEVLNVDTRMEFPDMYVHIENVRRIVEEHGIKFTVLRSEKSFEWYMLDKPIESDKYGTHYGYGWPSVKGRWCTKHMKVQLIESYLKPLKVKYNLIQCIGPASDEIKRLSRAQNTQQGHRHPLVEWGWSESDALEYCKGLGFDWGGLYDIFNRVSCWCCPLAAISELRKLWIYFPDLWRKLEEWETQLADPYHGKQRDYKFRGDISVFDLAKRFKLEQSRQERGLSIDSQGFYQNLKRITTKLPTGQSSIDNFGGTT